MELCNDHKMHDYMLCVHPYKVDLVFINTGYKVKFLVSNKLLAIDTGYFLLWK